MITKLYFSRTDGDISAGYASMIRLNKNKKKEAFLSHTQVNIHRKQLYLELLFALCWVLLINNRKFFKTVKKIFDRPKFALQFVSHCQTTSKREIYIEELKRHMNLTQLGACIAGRCSPECEKVAVGKPQKKRK